MSDNSSHNQQISAGSALQFEVGQIMSSAWRSIAEGRRNLENLENPRPVEGYVRKANEIVQLIPPGRILDWGCNYGQMAWLLHRRGFEVAALDVEENRHPTPLLDEIGVEPIFSSAPVSLPYPDASFDAVVSCGVLEHVADPDGSVEEIARVLKRGGYFLIFNLPNRWSWVEWLARQLGGGHERRYTFGSVESMFARNGICIAHKAYHDVVPCTFSSFTPLARKAAQLAAPLLSLCERIASQTPLQVLGTNLTIFGVKSSDQLEQNSVPQMTTEAS